MNFGEAHRVMSRINKVMANVKATGIVSRKGTSFVQCINTDTNRPFTLLRGIGRGVKSELGMKIEQTNDTTPRPKLKTRHGKILA